MSAAGDREGRGAEEHNRDGDRREEVSEEEEGVSSRESQQFFLSFLFVRRERAKAPSHYLQIFFESEKKTAATFRQK